MERFPFITDEFVALVKSDLQEARTKLQELHAREINLERLLWTMAGEVLKWPKPPKPPKKASVKRKMLKENDRGEDNASN